MPRNTDVPARLAVLQTEGAPDAMEQVPVRFPVSTAVALYEDCISREQKPGHRLREIIVDHYRYLEDGVQLSFDTGTRKHLDLVSRAYGLDRESVVKLCVQRSITTLLQEATEERKRQEDAAGKLEAATTKKPKR